MFVGIAEGLGNSKHSSHGLQVTGKQLDSYGLADRKPTHMNNQELKNTAQRMVAHDKGLLAMDESNPTCDKRFAKQGIPQTWRHAAPIGSYSSPRRASVSA